MSLRKKKEKEVDLNVPQPKEEEKYNFLRKKTIKELIAPAGIDASNIDHLEIISSVKK